jgi:hypothetical protein
MQSNSNNKVSPSCETTKDGVVSSSKNKYRKRMSRTQSVYLFLKNSMEKAAERRKCITKWVGCGMCCIGTIIALSVLIIGIIGASMVTSVPDPITKCYCNKMEGLTAPEIPKVFKVDTSCPKYANYDMTPYHTDNFTDMTIHPRGEEDVDIAAYYYPGDPSRNVDGETVILTPGYGASRTKYTLLIPARILQQMGFNVVSIDTRSHGDSDLYLDRRTSWGYHEHKDTLGKFSSLSTIKTHPPLTYSLANIHQVLGTGLLQILQMETQVKSVLWVHLWEDVSPRLHSERNVEYRVFSWIPQRIL